jgi:hypothetical protein
MTGRYFGIKSGGFNKKQWSLQKGGVDDASQIEELFKLNFFQIEDWRATDINKRIRPREHK